MNKPVTLLALVAACAASSGCAGFSKAIGAEKSAPDEFRVVTTAPLSLPPDYALRPPKPGDPRPQELRPDRQARAAVFGEDIAPTATPGERALVSRAGADAVDPNIRALVDLEGASLVRKNDGFTDRLLSFGATTPDAAPLDAEAEAKRLAELEAVRRTTGDGPITITRGESGRFKLPGL
jgi:hypothetical protein